MKKIAIVWDNFGPMHFDRCEAVARHFGREAEVVGIELAGKSATYAWDRDTTTGFRRITIFPGQSIEMVSLVRRTFMTLKTCFRANAKYLFFCHYEHVATLLCAIVLRIAGRKVYVMGCSKFDDFKRYLWRECLKRLFYTPYTGGIGSRRRSTDYMEFLGLPKHSVKSGYNTLSIDRIRNLAAVPPAPDGAPFSQRHFTIIARFVPKKNLSTAIEAYRLYRTRVANPHKLVLLGSGPLENALRSQVRQHNLIDDVVFLGFQQAPDVARRLGTSLALILPSVEEQFGNVVIEAQAMGVPILLSDACGARDELVRTAVNGFVVEPDNPDGFAFFMQLLSEDEGLWSRMCKAAQGFSALGDASRFAKSIEALVQGK